MNVDESKKPYWLAPFAATASQHFYGQTLKWEEASGDNPPTSQDQDYLEKNGAFQPVIYVGRNGHATYFRAGSIHAESGSPINPQFQYGPPGNVRDIVDGSQTRLILSDVLYPLKGSIINSWRGRWGSCTFEDWVDMNLVYHTGLIAYPPNEVGPCLTPYGPSSALFRGPANTGLNNTWIQLDPKGFHNAYIKTSQQSELLLP